MGHWHIVPSQQRLLPRVGPAAPAPTPHVKCPGGAQGVGADEGGGADAGEEVGLAGFEGDEAGEDVEDVQEFGGVLGKPAVGLDFSRGDGGRRSPMTGRVRSFLR